ncbi:leucine-rich repeat-containing protein 74A-like isoform X2 [Littorina saxatilis]|uniref:leucine-rich repeat-containing protein 74A-like isoform X2 n=1 Tax=Littorina saxatilis TaxID=31220 RepID=UPI0038B5C1BD
MSVSSRQNTAGSRPTTASSRRTESARSAKGYATPDATLERSKFDIWNFVKRPMTANPYELTARYRLSRAPARRARSGVISRRRRRAESNAGSEIASTHRTLASATDSLDFDKDFLEDYDFDAEDDLDCPRKSITGSHSQVVYVRMCKKLNITPNSYVFRNLVDDHLDLKHHLLGPEGVQGLCVSLIENFSVTSIDMEDNGLGNEGATFVSEMLSENTFVTELSIADNTLMTDGVKRIVDVIKDMDILTKLNISGNNLQEYDGEIVRDLIEESRSLKELRCSHNCFRETGGIAIGDAIGWNDSLELLDLSWNHLRREGATAICAALAINSGLKEVNVSWNGFYIHGSKELAKTLDKNKTLQVLDLSANRINKECLTHIMKGLKTNKTLRVLKLADNPITAVGALYVLRELVEMKESGIRELDLGEQSVEPEFLVVLEKLKEDRDIEVRFGAVLGQDVESKDQEQELMDENPVVVLMEFGKLLGLRLVDLFAMMDKDGSKTLTPMEIRKGLLEANIPLSEKALDALVNKLDADGDGEIDYAKLTSGELIAGQQSHRRKITKTIMMSREQKVDMEETEVGRVRSKLKKLMANQGKSKIRVKSGISLLQGKTATVVEPSQKPAPTEEGSAPALPKLNLKKGSLLKAIA